MKVKRRMAGSWHASATAAASSTRKGRREIPSASRRGSGGYHSTPQVLLNREDRVIVARTCARTFLLRSPFRGELRLTSRSDRRIRTLALLTVSAPKGAQKCSSGLPPNVTGDPATERRNSGAFEGHAVSVDSGAEGARSAWARLLDLDLERLLVLVASDLHFGRPDGSASLGSTGPLPPSFLALNSKLPWQRHSRARTMSRPSTRP
jgi:hypothetical protein